MIPESNLASLMLSTIHAHDWFYNDYNIVKTDSMGNQCITCGHK